MDAAQGDRAEHGGLDAAVGRLLRGEWLAFLPAWLREPAALALVQVAVAAATLALVAPLADARGEAYLEATFARTLAALAATRGLDSAISLAQSSEVSFSFGPGGSLGIGQALDPVNDLVEQYGALLLTSTTALGVQRLGMQIGRALGWWLFVPAVAALAVAAGRHRLEPPALRAGCLRAAGAAGGRLDRLVGGSAVPGVGLPGGGGHRDGDDGEDRAGRGG